MVSVGKNVKNQSHIEKSLHPANLAAAKTISNNKF